MSDQNSSDFNVKVNIGADSAEQRLQALLALCEKIQAVASNITVGGAAGGNAGSVPNAAETIKAKTTKGFIDRASYGFVSRMDIGHVSSVVAGDVGPDGLPISQGAYSVREYMQAQEVKAQRGMVKDYDNLYWAQRFGLNPEASSTDIGIARIDDRYVRDANLAVKRAETGQLSEINRGYEVGKLQADGHLISPDADRVQIAQAKVADKIERDQERRDREAEREVVRAERNRADVNWLGRRGVDTSAISSETDMATTRISVNDSADAARMEETQRRYSNGVGSSAMANLTLSGRRMRMNILGADLPDDADEFAVKRAEIEHRNTILQNKIDKNPSVWDDFQSGYGGRFARGAAYAVGSSAAEYAHSVQNEQMTGRPDYLSQGNSIGSAIGGIAGAAIGSLFPGYGTFIGAGVGMQLGGTVGSFMEVGGQKEMLTAISAQPIAALSANYFAGRSGDWSARENVTSRVYNPGSQAFGVSSGPTSRTENLPSVYAGSLRIADRAAWARESIGKEIAGAGYDKAASTVEGMASNYEAAYLGILDSGEDPDAPMPGTQGVNVRTIGTRKKLKSDSRGQPVYHWVDDPFTDQTETIHHDDTWSRSTPNGPQQTSPTDNLRGTSPRAANTIVSAGRGGNYSAVLQAVDSGGGISSSGGLNSTTTLPTIDSKGWIGGTSHGSIHGMRQKWVQDTEDEPITESTPTGKPALRKDWIAENAERWFLTGADEIMKKVFEPIAAAKPKTGDNIADIITQFGGRAAAQYEQILTPYGTKPPIDVKTATEFGAKMAGAERAATLAQLSVRDSGLKSMQAADSQMNLMIGKNGEELIPGVKDSVVYAQTVQKQISGQLATWKENDTTGFNMSRMHLQAEEQRYEVSPYSPGNRMGMELRGIKMDKDQISVIQHRESYLKQKGMLSEQEEFDMESQIEGLKTDRARSIGNMVDNVANRLPAMAAGRPAFAGRIDSRMMTAMQFGLMDHPYRGAGAMNDHQRRMQQNFVSSYMDDPSEIDSRSRTVTLNNGSSRAAGSAQYSNRDSTVYHSNTGMQAPVISSLSGGSSGNSGGHPDAVILNRIADLLQQILNKPNGGGFSRSGQMPGERPGISNFYRNGGGDVR